MKSRLRLEDPVIPADASRGFGEALDALPAGLIMLDIGARIAHANRAALGLLQRDLASTRLQPIADLLPADDAVRLLQTIAATRQDPGSVTSGQFRFLLPSGDVCWAMVSLSLAPEDEGGGITPCLLQIQSIDQVMREKIALSKNEVRWKYALESAHQGVWDHDFSNHDMFYSDTWKSLRGLPLDAVVDGSLDTWILSVHPDDRAHVLESIRRQEEGAVSFDLLQYREQHADGHWIWIESRGSSVAWGPDGKPTRNIGTDTDITERKNAERRLEEISRRLHLALDVSRIGVFEADLETGDAIWDGRMREIYGNDSSDMTVSPETFENLIHPDDRLQAVTRIERALKAGIPFTNAFRIVKANGSVRHIRANCAPYTDGDGRRKLIGANWDVTSDVAMQEELAQARTLAEARAADLEAARVRIEYNALHDHLTGLPNRRFLDARLSASEPGHSAVLHLDLDRFKQINDTLGHAAGDAMLVHTAHTLMRLTCHEDFVARVGGDEFVILCSQERSEQAIAHLAEQIIEALRQPVNYEGHMCRFGASIGIAWTDGRNGADQPLMNADIALYRAKSMGRNRFEFFSEQVQAQLRHAKKTADDILDGMEAGEFIPYYQPQFYADTLEIAGLESLVRWNHPIRGILAPDAFLKIAEEINALQAIDRLILEKALKDLELWRNAGLVVPKVSVNVSSRRLREPDLVESLKKLQFKRGSVAFELLESIFLDDPDEPVLTTITALKDLGIDIEIDDFGTGHASIVGLLKLSPNRLKIDRALVLPIRDMPDQRKLVGAIIDMGHSLGISVVAEGVETFDHASILRDLGCDVLQGYAFARPMSMKDTETFIRTRAWLKHR